MRLRRTPARPSTRSCHKPKSIDHDEACTIPITFLTAYYGLVRLAQLQPGERVLIHAGAGGVGLAAIQIAQQIGAEIFATAGSDAEARLPAVARREARLQQPRRRRSPRRFWPTRIGEGVDVVLNSLPGEAITKSLSILRAYGRFLEIGKTDIYQNRMIGLLPFQDNLSYFAIDLDRMLRQRPDYIRELFAEVMQHFEAGALPAADVHAVRSRAARSTRSATCRSGRTSARWWWRWRVESRESESREPENPTSRRSDRCSRATARI